MVLSAGVNYHMSFALVSFCLWWDLTGLTSFISKSVEIGVFFVWFLSRHGLGVVKCVVVVSRSGCDSRVVQSCQVKSMGSLGWRGVLSVLVEIDVIVWWGMNDNSKSVEVLESCKLIDLLSWWVFLISLL